MAKADGAIRDQVINVALAEKRSDLRTVEYFRERAARADIGRALELLERAGDEPPREGDEIVLDVTQPRRSRRSQSSARSRR